MPATRVTKSFTRIAPSRSEYWEWTWIYVLLVRECAGDVRREPEEVFVSLCGRSQERKVAKLAAEDRLNLVREGLLVEAQAPEHRVVIGQRDRAVRALDQIFHPDRAVEERVLGVDVEVNELSHGASVTPPRRLRHQPMERWIRATRTTRPMKTRVAVAFEAP